MAFRLEIADFGAFYERTYQVAFRTAYGIVRDISLAADVTHEAYASAYAARHRFRGESPSQAWLHRIVVNTALSMVRRRGPKVHELTVVDFGGPDDTAASAQRMELWDALDLLRPKPRAAVILRYYLDYDYVTIAEILDTTPTNVGSILSRAIDQLRRDLASSQPPVAVVGAE